jgi:hypothetical protein
MKRFVLCFCLTLSVLLTCAPLRAAVFERDWKTEGDGLLTYDDVNRREWLDLSQTILSDQFPGEDPSPFVTRENRYQYVVSQTVPGGLFDGFSVAKSLDVIAFAESAGIDTSTLDENTNAAAALSLGELLGFTLEAPNGNKIAIGLLDEMVTHRFDTLRLGAGIYSVSFQAGVSMGMGHYDLSTPPGVMLYWVVPEPSTAALIGAALCATTIIRLRNRRQHCTTNVVLR